jgi:hypothetical protein
VILFLNTSKLIIYIFLSLYSLDLVYYVIK